MEKTFIIVIFAKNAPFRSYSVICLPQMPLTTPEPIPMESTQRGHDITIRDLTKNSLFRSYVTFACGHELSGHVHAHAYNYYAWAECVWVQNKLQITPLSE